MAPCSLQRIFFMSAMVIWILATIYILHYGPGIGSIEAEQHGQAFIDNEGTLKMLKSIQMRLDQCQSKNELLGSRVVELLKRRQDNSIGEKGKNSTDSSLRVIYNNVVELWYFIRARISALKSEDGLPKKVVEDLGHFIEDAEARKNAALIEIELLQSLRDELHEGELRKLQDVVRRRIHFIQNPKDCDSAKKVVCNLKINCGFGCQLHHLTLCLLIAMGTQRTFVLNSDNWKYSGEGWESMFLPLSDTCTKVQGSPRMWNGEEQTKDVQVVTLPIIAGLKQRPSFLPLRIPKDLAQTLTKYHGNPSVWWLGQLVSYLIRPQPDLQQAIHKFEEKIGFSHPIVGLHIRRTDKIGTEASFHHISEYMTHVVEWFDKEELKRQRIGINESVKRLVYVASDDNKVLAQAKELYPSYTFLGDSEISKSAGLPTRYSKSSLIGLLTDIYLLSKCDYMVGTFSSQISRAVYELMQTHHPDASAYAHSLDDIHYFAGQFHHFEVAAYDHEARPGTGEISMKSGDIIHVAGNHWDGFSKGINRRTGKNGLYPSFKVVDIVTTAEFPIYGPENFNLTSDLET